jgi:peptidoglycan hydrolase-like protein with peptidoglycan-binding domain
VKVDGIFGPRTAEAVRRFQHRWELVVDGAVGPATWTALIISVRRGASGDAVRAVQEEFEYRSLCGCRGERDTVDGVFGPRTDEAVRRFQYAVRTDAGMTWMPVDGNVGPMTWRALISGMLAYQAERTGRTSVEPTHSR